MMRNACFVVCFFLLTIPVFNTALGCDDCGCSDLLIKAVEMENSGVPDSHPVDLIEGLNIELVQIPETRCAYLEGTVLGDMDKLFGKVMSEAGKQGLFSADFKIGSAYPDDMSKDITEDTRVYCGMTIPFDAEVSAPLLTATIPSGMFLQIEHVGDYALLEITYGKIFEWAAEYGVTFTPPTYEVYLTNPETTPVDQWITYIYLPFDHEALKESFIKGPEDDEHTHHEHNVHNHEH